MYVNMQGLYLNENHLFGYCLRAVIVSSCAEVADPCGKGM